VESSVLPKSNDKLAELLVIIDRFQLAILLLLLLPLAITGLELPCPVAVYQYWLPPKVSPGEWSSLEGGLDSMASRQASSWNRGLE
jgi:hypothetical protein